MEDFLYNLEKDPHERNNLVTDPAFLKIRKDMAQTLKRRMVEAGEKEPTILRRDQVPSEAADSNHA